ncbi:MAG TPA: VOC family protein, partial [Stellaceae bacterium]|nr:VOC family protein [Stellaceae bacterium]
GSAVNVGEAKRRTRLLATREARRSANSVRRLHHHAVRTDDMEKTRHFYEDLLGLPLVASMKGAIRSPDGKDIPFLHCFFELGDGSSLAFFQLAPGKAEPADRLPRDGLDHHLAVAIPDAGELLRLKGRLDEAGIANCGSNHGFCYSLYLRDPNGMLLELTTDAADELERTEPAAASAHALLAEWMTGDFAPTDTRDRPMPFPLPTSPRAASLRLIRGIEAGEDVPAAWSMIRSD